MEKYIENTLEFFKQNILPNTYDENMFNPDGSINKNYNSFKKTGLIAQILDDHWNDFYAKNQEIVDQYRNNAPEEIDKIIKCANKQLGCSIYTCPNCHDAVFVGHTCKSRLCSSCGYKYKNERVENILQTAFACPHRQLVFTIPKELRKYFFDFNLMDLLFNAVKKTIYSLLNESYKYSKKQHKMIRYFAKEIFIPGFFAFLHTFGRDMKWNPHIHILLAEIKASKTGKVLKWDYFNFDALSKRFQKILLDLLSKELGSAFDKEKYFLKNKYNNGFYVYAEKKKFNSIKDGIEYVTRYCGRTPISENRILNYDGTNVTFSYNDHVDESYHEITVSAEKFIFILLRHIIPTQYKIIRYYGFYRKKLSFHDKIKLLVSEEKRNIRKSFLKHGISILTSFHRDPYKCPKCNTKLSYLFTVP